MKKPVISNEEEVPLPSSEVAPLNEASIFEILPPKQQPAPITLEPRALAFLREHFPMAEEKDWANWKWQLSNSITTLDKLSAIVNLTKEETRALSGKGGVLPLRITPHYASLLAKTDPRQPIRRSVVPVIAEHQHCFGEAADPLHEENDSPVSGIVHRYPDRVLFLATGFCSTYCRYCTRSRMVGDANRMHQFSTKIWDEAIDYIRRTPAIRDVLISGGDPLTMPDAKIEYLLAALRKIEHIEVLRIGTKVPVVLPQRITPKLVNMFKKYHPLFVSIHFTHPDEVTPEVAQACMRLADAGIPLGSQTVLLKGINDDVQTMARLFHQLLKIRVRPYYLYQCDPIFGSGHFRTTVEKGLEIIQGLRGHTSGYAIPQFVVDAPGGGGKTPLLPDYWQGRDAEYVYMKNYEGNLYRYPNVQRPLEK